MPTKPTAKTAFEKKGGYPSSSKPAAELKPPPRGPAPGARPPKQSNGQHAVDRPS